MYNKIPLHHVDLITKDPVSLHFNLLLICSPTKPHRPFPADVHKLTMQIPGWRGHFTEMWYLQLLGDPYQKLLLLPPPYGSPPRPHSLPFVYFLKISSSYSLLYWMLKSAGFCFCFVFFNHSVRGNRFCLSLAYVTGSGRQLCHPKESRA